MKPVQKIARQRKSFRRQKSEKMFKHALTRRNIGSLSRNIVISSRSSMVKATNINHHTSLFFHTGASFMPSSAQNASRSGDIVEENQQNTEKESNNDDAIVEEEDIIYDEVEDKHLYPETKDFITTAVEEIKEHLPYMYNGKPIPPAPHGILPPSLYDYKITNLLFSRITKEPDMDFSIGTVEELAKLEMKKGDDGFPMVEVAFCGRSNVGKSSLVNAVVGHEVSRVSSTPGHTKRLNFFNIGEKVYLVDLPGYGYAEGNLDEIEKWTQVMGHYLATRSDRLKRVFLLVDSRRGLTKLDKLVLEFLTKNPVSHQIILTKCDKISHEELYKLMEDVYKFVDTDKRFFLCYPYLIPCSSLENKGIDEVKCAIVNGSGLKVSVRLMNEKQKIYTMQKEKEKMMKDLTILNPDHPLLKTQREILEELRQNDILQEQQQQQPQQLPDGAPMGERKTSRSNKRANTQKKLPPQNAAPVQKPSVVIHGLYGEEDD